MNECLENAFNDLAFCEAKPAELWACSIRVIQPVSATLRFLFVRESFHLLSKRVFPDDPTPEALDDYIREMINTIGGNYFSHCFEHRSDIVLTTPLLEKCANPHQAWADIDLLTDVEGRLIGVALISESPEPK